MAKATTRLGSSATGQVQDDEWWAHKGSNLGPLPCEGNALPLSYAPGTIMQTAGLSAGQHIGDRDLEVQAKAVKFSGAPGPENLTPVTPFAKETAFSARSREIGRAHV